MPATEIMLNTPIVKRLLEQNKLDMLSEAVETGHEDGMHNFNQSLHKLIAEDKITEEEGMRHATNPGALRMALGGISANSGRRILMR